MSARGIPVQDEYPEGYQLRPVQEEDPAAPVAEEAPFESKSVRRRKAVQAEADEEAPVEEAPAAVAPAAD